MSKLFIPCLGKTACRDDGERCLSCGRSLDEIMRTRQLLDELSTLVLEMDYSNTDEFAAYIARKLGKKVAHAREQTANQEGNLT